MRVFQRGETVEVYAEVKTQAGVLVNPDTSIKVTIFDPSSEKILLAAPNYDADMPQFGGLTGKYAYYYIITDAAASVGWWAVEVMVLDGTKYTKVIGGFLAE